MRKIASSLKAIGPCLAVAGTAQFIVCRMSPGDYSETTLLLFLAGWGVCTLAVAWFEERPLLVYLGAVTLAAPGISYSMLGYGALEMGGWLHAFAAGVLAIPFHLLFRHLRGRRAAVGQVGAAKNP